VLPPADDWRSPDVDALLDAFLLLQARDEAAAFLRDLCTLGELRDLAQRWAVVRLLADGRHYAEISRTTGASTATITRIASWLHHGAGGYGLALERAGLPAGRAGRAGVGSSAAAPAHVSATAAATSGETSPDALS
jgi:TrpR-related protein YerC/YecD